MTDDRPAAADETMVTDITLMPDGRVYVFGTSRAVLELLAELDPTDGHVRQLLETAAEADRSGVADAVGIRVGRGDGVPG